MDPRRVSLDVHDISRREVETYAMELRMLPAASTSATTGPDKTYGVPGRDVRECGRILTRTSDAGRDMPDFTNAASCSLNFLAD
jgi:hypothetical protein